MVIIKIIVKAKVLLVIEAMVYAYRKLIATIGLYRGRHEPTAAVSWNWNVLEQIYGSRVKTL